VPALSFVFNPCYSQKKSSETARNVPLLPDKQRKCVVTLSKMRGKPCPSGRGWIAWPLQVACFSLLFVVVRYIPE
jgi:hypothetical protein